MANISRDDDIRAGGYRRGNLHSVFKIRHRERQSMLGLRRLDCRNLNEFQQVFCEFPRCGCATSLLENVMDIRQRVPGYYALPGMLLAPIENRPTVGNMGRPVQGYIKEHIAIQ